MNSEYDEEKTEKTGTLTGTLGVVDGSKLSVSQYEEKLLLLPSGPVSCVLKILRKSK